MKLKWFGWLISIVLFVVLAFGVWRASTLLFFAIEPNSSGNQKMVISVRSGHHAMSLAKELEAAGIVASASKFYKLGIYLRKWKALKAGEYEVLSTQTPLEIFEILSSGVSVGVRVTIPEGYNLFQIADLLDAAGITSKNAFKLAAQNKDFINELGIDVGPADRLEGYLFPDTYRFARNSDPKTVISAMVKRFNSQWTEDFSTRALKLGLTRHQTVTLASIIEKETGDPKERPLISSVFHNRLRKGMRMQSDPTTIYGIWEHFDGNLRKKDLLNKTKYNTYQIKGLPVGPIGNPGSSAIHSALYPNVSSYLYFVSQNDGTHVFTNTFKEHSDAVKRHQLNRSAREGKSWRDLSRKLGTTK